MTDDDIWTTSDTEPAVTPDDYPTPDTEPSDHRFWTIGRAAAVVIVAVAVGALAYWVASRGNDDDTVTASGDMTAGDEVPAADLWGRTWEVVRLEMGTDQPVLWSKGDTDVALDLDLTVEGQVRFSGCNGGSGAATYTGGVLQATDLMGTMMACPDDEGIQLMAYDEWMSGFLTDGVAVSFDEGTLVLTGPNGTAWLTGPGQIDTPDPSASTVPGDPDDAVSSPDVVGGSPTDSNDLAADLWGHRWAIRAITPADSLTPRPLVMADDGTAPTVDTTETDRLTISGCNGTGGAVHLDGDQLVADGPWMQTKMACQPDLMDQENFLTTFLEAGPTVSITDDLLTLTGDDTLVLAVRS